MTQVQRTLPRKVAFARDALVSYIHDKGLNAGDRLPSYATLREVLGLGSQTIAEAISTLVESNVLEVRNKVGIFVKNPAGGHLAGRTIAVAVRPLDGSAYAATLASFIQKLLSEHNCQCLTFYRNSNSNASEANLEDFTGLEQVIREKECDGLISLCPLSNETQKFLKKLGIVSCFIGDDDENNMDNCVVIEVQHFILEATNALKESGCQNIAQICVTQEQLKKRQFGLNSLIGSSYNGGSKIADNLLQIDEKNRPDGLVSDDDTVVNGLLARLIEQQLPEVKYLPQVATIVHKELEEIYPSNKMILFEQSIEEYAKNAVSLLLSILQGKEKEKNGNRIVYRFKLLSNALI
jgi:DNA-binding LacI/PurR family transcriptional regulator